MSNTSPELVLAHVVGIRRQLRFSFAAASMSAKLVPLLLVVIALTSAYKSPKHKIWRQRVITWAFRDPFKLVVNDESRQLDASQLVVDEKDLTKPPGIDIDILFARGIHGDKEAFDGKGNMVAHSGYSPQGILHLDADEDWSFDGSHGIDLRYVMIHEIGHLLGLRHSRKKSSIMSKYYRRLITGMRIPQVDVQFIRRLYQTHDSYS
ncbi:hypothetical protein Aduo_007681 [Ancylostoma duodenale]